MFGRRSRATAREPDGLQEGPISIVSSPVVELLLTCLKVRLAGFLALVSCWSVIRELHVRLSPEESIRASVLNGDDQDRRRLCSPFAGPPPRFVSSPSRPPPQVSSFSNGL
jgi:hypothetical protein